jgi:hypothetical protein
MTQHFPRGAPEVHVYRKNGALADKARFSAAFNEIFGRA